MEPVSVIGVGMTEISPDRKEDTFADLVFEACSKALQDAEMTIDEIDTVVTGSNDFFDGRTISSMAVMDACGSYDKNVTTVEGDGTFGATFSVMRVLSMGFDTCLYCVHHKGSESEMPLITNAMFDPVYERSLGIDALASAALQARAYMNAYGITEEQCAEVSVKNHRNAIKNPIAQLPLEITVNDVMASPYIAEPLKLLDCAPISDGASAIILANESRAKKAARKPVWVKGMGYNCDAFHLGDRDLSKVAALTEASRIAYGMAGIGDPVKEIDLLEVYDAFSYMELMWIEGLGLCDGGAAARLTESGKTSLEGEIPVNASGGCISGNPVLVAGLNRIIECVLQIRGGAEEHQVEGAGTAVAQGINGPCGQSQCVWVLGGEK